MIVTNLKTNHIINPIGFDLGQPHLSFITSDTAALKQTAARIQVSREENFEKILFDSGISTEIDSLSYPLPPELEPGTRYYWRVSVWTETGETATSDPAWFETARMDMPWQAKWISPTIENTKNSILYQNFTIKKEIASARAYICGLGLYELNINSRKAGDEFLAPGFHAYDQWIQYQTYDLTSLLHAGENTLEIMLGSGWYLGRVFHFGPPLTHVYGDNFAAIAEIVVTYTDQTTETICTDSSWKSRYSPIVNDSIYDGELFDATIDMSESFPVNEVNLGYEKLKSRLSLPVKIKEEIKPVAFLKSPAQESILDFGQNMVGWVSFHTSAPKGTIIKLSYCEILQNGNFYRDNLGSAKAEFTYVSDGSSQIIRPHFTYFGFRYVKVEINGEAGMVDPEDFVGQVLYSDMEIIGNITTSDHKLNRLFENVRWSQKGNFLDVPTDCPQRDERMGWTGDAQIFSGTAGFNMDTTAFFSKYLYDLAQEQSKYQGSVPHVIPSNGYTSHGSAAWGDAAVIIPWNTYLYTGDKAILQSQFSSMKAWVDYIKKLDDEHGKSRLWNVSNHFGDWLSLDTIQPDTMTGATDPDFIASLYYYYSTTLVAKSAKIIGMADVSSLYFQLADEIKNAIVQEYFTPTGRLSVDTQTGYVLSLYMEIVPDKYIDKTMDGLVRKLKESNYHLTTGFVGTPYICQVLSRYGRNDLAYRLIFNEDYPGWLYCVKMGATTIWERWNSVMPDGTMSKSGMNSLNHYAYGAIAEWMYRYMAGFHPDEWKPGFRHMNLYPMPDERLEWLKADYQSAAGTYRISWNYDTERFLTISLIIPFNTTATLILPDSCNQNVKMNGTLLHYDQQKTYHQDICLELTAGDYQFYYKQEHAHYQNLHAELDLNVLMEVPAAKKLICDFLPEVASLPPFLLSGSLDAFMHSPFSDKTRSLYHYLDTELKKIK